MASSLILASMVCASMTTSSCANNFLRASVSAPAGERVSEASVRQSLVEEIEGALGSGSTGRRVARLEAALRPMFAALPKNQYGNLGHSTVRYALHRLFVQRYAWYVKGLEPDGAALNASTPTGVLKDHLPSYVQDLFESRLDGHGFSLHDTAVFAATLEHLVHNEAVERVEKAYVANELQKSDSLTAEQVDHVLDAYMKIYIFGEQATTFSDETLTGMYPGWKNTQTYVRDMRKSVSYAEGDHSESAGNQTLSFTAVTRVLEEVGENYGAFQDSDCRQMKTDLLKYGDEDTGRVRLASFYQASLDHGSTQFSESKEYLRQIGALDETDPNEPRVIVPNYIASPGNCITTLGQYSVCCTNECEPLLASMERDIQSPEAEPERVVELVSALLSGTGLPPKNLSAPLLYRLDEIAANHGGTVPLHGRLFAQWMHHAFPRECPYPHEAGTTNPQTPDEWMMGVSESSRSASLSPAEMQRVVDNFVNSDPVYEQAMPWSAAEELLVTRSSPVFAKPDAGATPWTRLRGVALLLATISVVLGPAYGAFHSTQAIRPGQKCLDKIV